jgi:hypothetical protein
MWVAGGDLDPAHGQWRATGFDRAEAVAALLGLLQQPQVDLDIEDLLHAPHVDVPPRLVCVYEGAGLIDAP